MRKSCLESYLLELKRTNLFTYRMYHRKTPRGLDREVFAFLNLMFQQPTLRVKGNRRQFLVSL